MFVYSKDTNCEYLPKAKFPSLYCYIWSGIKLEAEVAAADHHEVTTGISTTSREDLYWQVSYVMYYLFVNVIEAMSSSVSHA